jgi:hypothetical protein
MTWKVKAAVIVAEYEKKLSYGIHFLILYITDYYDHYIAILQIN